MTLQTGIIANKNNLVLFRDARKGNKSSPTPYEMTRIDVFDPYVDPYGSHVSLNAASANADIVTGRVNRNTANFSRVAVTNARNAISNKCLSKLDGELDVTRSFFEDWYERKQSAAMLVNALSGVLDFVRNWKKPRYWKKMAGRVKPSTLPEAWLAYNFGIKPLVGTINDSLNFLGNDLPNIEHRVSSRGHYDFIQDSAYGPRLLVSCDMIVTAGCTVYGINPNTALLQATGLNQPFSSAFSVLPWGWALDYFVNVSELLSNFESKHPGLLTKNHWYTEYERTFYTGYVKKVWQPDYTQKNCPISGQGVHVRRYAKQLGFKPTLSLPLIGSGRFANLSSAVALTMKKG